MCALIGSSDKSMFKSLYELNSYRGQLSYSLCSFSTDRNTSLQVLLQDRGKMSADLIDDLPSNSFFIGHSQAPTTEATSIHPAIIGSSMLWHNGIVKQREIPVGVWDTEWLLKGITTSGFDFLSTVIGSFACVLYMNNNLYVFRNEISPLFVDDKLNLSSTQFVGGRSLEPNTVFMLNITDCSLVEVTQFETGENPYFFG